MIIFKHLWLLILLPAPLLLYFLLPPFRQRVLAIRIPFFDLAVHATGAKTGAGSQIHAKSVVDVVLASLIWIALVIALTEPVRLSESVTEKRVTRDIMLAIDLSGSMEEKDFPDASGQKIGRLDAVKNVVSEYIDARKDDRVGLIVFGTRAYLQVPFTRDLASAKQILNDSSVAMAGPHTAIGDAIGLALKHFESSQVKDRVLIVLTDGADTGSRMSPINAAHIAAQDKLKIYTIGIGDEHGEGQYRVDFATLQKIASITDGKFYSADDSSALQGIYREIDNVTASVSEKNLPRQEQSLVYWPLLAALLVLLLAMLKRVIADRITVGSFKEASHG